MLKILRKKGVAKKILWVITIVIVISFGGFWGTGYLLGNRGRDAYAGKIFGKKISGEDFKKIYEHTRIQTMIHYGENFYKVSRFLNLEAETWDRIILLHEAQKRKIEIPDNEVIKTIEQFPFFNRNGQFDSLLYHNILRNILRVEPRTFEESVRDNLKITKLYEQVTAGVPLKEEEIFQAYKKRNEQIQVSYVLISPDDFKNEALYDEKKAQEYFQSHKNEFLIAPSINVDYLSLFAPEGEQNPNLELLKQNALAVSEKLKTHPSLKETASQNNLEVKTSGLFSLDQPNLSLGWSFEVLNKVYQLDLNQISEPLETPRGYVIVQMKEKQNSRLPEYAEVKDKAKDAYLREQAKGAALEKAKEYREKIKSEYDQSSVPDFPKIAQKLNLKILQTPVFNRGQYLPAIGLAKEFQEAAFGLDEKNKISDAVATDKGYSILYLDRYIPVDEAQYQKDKETFSQTLQTEQKNEVFSGFLTQLRLQAGLVDYLAKENNPAH